MQRLSALIPLLAFSAASAQNMETSAAFKTTAPKRYSFVLKELAGPEGRQTTLFPASVVKDVSSLKNIPGPYPHSCVRKFVVNSDQAMNEQFRRGAYSAEEYAKRAKRWNIDSAFVSPDPMPQNSVHLFVALDSTGKKHVIVDANNNLDFSDDKEIIIDTADCDNKDIQERVIPCEIPVEVFDGKTISKKILKAELDPYRFHFTPGSYDSRTEQLLDVVMRRRLSWSADIDVEGIPEKIKLTAGGNSLLPVPGSRFNLSLASDSLSMYHYVRDEKVEIGNGVYKWHTAASINEPGKMEVIFEKVADRPRTGSGPGDIAPDFAAKDIITGKKVQLKQFKGQYVLIDFWGTWCGPCKEMIPELVEAHKKYKDKNIAFVSIALDHQKDTAVLKKIIGDFGMSWTNLHQEWEHFREDNSLTKMYKTVVFPTTILLDEKGKVIHRGTAAEGFRKAAPLLDKWIEKNGR